MLLRPPRTTRPDTRLPYTTLFRSRGDVRHNCRCPDRTRLPDDYASRGVCVLRTSDASPSMQPTAQAHRTRVCVRAPRRGPGESAWSRSSTPDTECRRARPCAGVARLLPDGWAAADWGSAPRLDQIGRASCRERVCQYV